MRFIRRNNGQFIPMSAMIMFSMTVFMIAMVVVYQISRAKLKVQNLADAAALNLASQEAQAYNIVTDRNEWMNHMIAGAPSPSDPNAPGYIKDCSAFNDTNKTLIPGISCIENTGTPDVNNAAVHKRHVFPSIEGAQNYASLIQTINEAQYLFVQAYNSFLGAPTANSPSASSTAGPANFIGLLKKDIPDFENDPSIHLVAWNNSAREPNMQAVQQMATDNDPNQSNMVPYMDPLRFKVDHDIQTRFYQQSHLGFLHASNTRIYATTLGDLVFCGGKPPDFHNLSHCGPHPAVGWLVPDTGSQPRIGVEKSGGTSNNIGVGVYVTKTVKVPILGTIPVSARSKAYLVESAGKAGDRTSQDNGVPRFKPTFWVKLAN
jgi:hypothetical protein